MANSVTSDKRKSALSYQIHLTILSVNLALRIPQAVKTFRSCVKSVTPTYLGNREESYADSLCSIMAVLRSADYAGY